MAEGIDTSVNCLGVIDALKNSGIEFVGRYYANTGAKVLSIAEARAISAAGLKLVSVWEDGYPTSAGYFSYAKGVDDGTSAYHDAMNIGQPTDSPIYFAVDYDPSLQEITGCVGDYFRGVKAGFAAIGWGQSVHPIGVYGSGATCSWLLLRQYVKYSWLSQSSGYRGSREFASWNLKQGATTKSCGIEIDGDEGVEDYGGFSVLT